MNKPFSKISAHVLAFSEQIKQCAAALNLPISDNQVQSLLRYLDGLLLWSKAYNLTAITEPKEALVKHIFDCLAIVPNLPFAHLNNQKLLDIGTGAGLPAVVLAIMRPDWQISALDSNQKKIRFIRQMASELNLTNIVPIASRIEQHQSDFSQHYHVITSRAFASLSDFVALATPCLHPNGVLYAMKGKAPCQQELQALLDWRVDVSLLDVPNLQEERCVVLLSKII